MMQSVLAIVTILLVINVLLLLFSVNKIVKPKESSSFAQNIDTNNGFDSNLMKNTNTGQQQKLGHALQGVDIKVVGHLKIEDHVKMASKNKDMVHKNEVLKTK